MSIGAPKPLYYQFADAGNSRVIQKTDQKQHGTLYMLQELDATKQNLLIYRAKDVESHYKVIARNIFERYTNKFGFCRHFNGLLLLLGSKLSKNWGDPNYEAITRLYKNIMKSEYADRMMDEVPETD